MVIFVIFQRIYTVKERVRKEEPLFCWQKNNANYLVTSGRDQTLNIYDRYGRIRNQLNLPGTCTSLEWDKDGDVLAAVCDQSPMIFLWDSNTERSSTIDTGLRDVLTLMIWSKGSQVLAVGTNKGNLLIYNHQTSRKVPILGKHSKKITCGAWSNQNLLALGSADKTLTVSNLDGDNVRQVALRGEMSQMKFSEMKQEDSRSSGQNTVSLVLDGETLYLYNIYQEDDPVELAFQSRYGKISDYQWYGDGYIAIGFTLGHLLIISTHIKELGNELFQVRNHKDYLAGLAVCPQMQKAASIGDNCIRVHELQDFRTVYSIATLDDESKLTRVEWTDDGQLLAVSSDKGNIHVYLTKMPVISDVRGSKNCLSYIPNRSDTEPEFIALGIHHIIIGMNNCAWFYMYNDSKKIFIFTYQVLKSVELYLCVEPTSTNNTALESRYCYFISTSVNVNSFTTFCLQFLGAVMFDQKEYLGTIQSIKLNHEYVAALFDGKIQLHLIDPADDIDSSKMFPLDDEDSGTAGNEVYKITCLSLSQEFLIYGTSHGALYFFYLEDMAMVNEFRHHCGIVNIYPDNATTRLIFIDEKSDAYIYNPIDDQTILVPDLASNVVSVIWESWPPDKNIFIVYDREYIYTYIHRVETIEGPQINLLGQTNLPPNQFPKMLDNGEVLCQTQSGKIAFITLSTHGIRDNLYDLQPSELKDLFNKDILLERFDEAWTLCQQFSNSQSRTQFWEKLAEAAIYSLQVDFGIKVYRQIKNVGMVWSLLGVKDIEDRSLLSGYLAMFLGKFMLAQDLFLNSSNPITALEMRRDLLHWDQALQLANKLAPTQMPFISKEYALQLEFVGDYPNALLHYERGLTDSTDNVDHNNVCNAGIARMALRCGDVRRGSSIAQKMEGRLLKRECAEILENMKQYNEAAILYVEGKYFDKAASLYIRLKNWNEVKNLLSKITSHKIFGQYAKAKEVDKNYQESAKAYKLAQDYDNLIRILLENLNNPEEAVKIVKESNSVEGAKMVARFFQRLNDYSSAIKFLIMSKCNDEAFQLAQSHNIMDLYAEIISDTADATPDNYRSIAVHFENNNNLLMAGKFYLLAKLYSKAMGHLLKVASSEDAQALQLAVETAGAANDPQLTTQLIDFLMGEYDGIPKVRTISKDFKYLFRLYMSLKQYHDAAKTAVIIAREEQNAAEYVELWNYYVILYRLSSEDVWKYLDYAAMLMRPEYRNQMDLKYKKKIETIVRKTAKGTEEDEPMTPCPYCDIKLSETDLFCPECKNNIPYCIASGRHLVKDNLTICPHCNFPAILSEFKQLLEADPQCPMCSERLDSSTLVPVEKDKINSVLHQDEIEK
ncbi:WD repeat-containing protein 19 [Nymphon striatum]|nr:WD repeat-containing protein 19 [Nymphon striatum]